MKIESNLLFFRIVDRLDQLQRFDQDITLSQRLTEELCANNKNYRHDREEECCVLGVNHSLNGICKIIIVKCE